MSRNKRVCTWKYLLTEEKNILDYCDYTLSYIGSKFVLEKFFQRTSKFDDSDFEFLGTVQVEHTIWNQATFPKSVVYRQTL